MYIDNIVCLPGQPGDVLSPDPSSAERVIISASNEPKSCLHDLGDCRESEMPSRGILLSTYEELSLIASVALLIVAILNLKNKK